MALQNLFKHAIGVNVGPVQPGQACVFRSKLYIVVGYEGDQAYILSTGGERWIVNCNHISATNKIVCFVQ